MGFGTVTGFTGRTALVVLATLSLTAVADTAAPITAVVLYPGSATIVRSLPVMPGTRQLVVPGLPARFDPQTLRVEAGPGIHLGEIVTLDAARTEAANPAEAELEAKILALQDQQAALDAEARSAEIVKGYLERFDGVGAADPASPGKPRGNIDGKTLTGLIDSLGKGASDALGRLQRLAVQKRELGKKIDPLQRDLARLRSGARDTRTVMVGVSADKAGAVKLSYQVHNAGWKPAYRAELDSTTSRVELERLATISQKTGEDWSNVTLTLSTSQPRQSPVGPDPQPWLLSWHPPRPAADLMFESAASPAPRAAGLARLKAAPDEKEEAPYAPPVFATQSSFATEFAVPARVNLPADGREVSVALGRQTLPVKQRLRVTPRLDTAAMVIADAERPAGVWPAGNVQLFRDGNYVGASHWNPQLAPRLQLSFGRDERLRVAVNQVKGDSGTTGVFDKRAERRIADVFTVTSSHPTPVDLQLLEPSPVSTSDEIRVEATFTPPPTVAPWDQRRGVVAWEKTLAPHETASFGVDYRIAYPREGSVGGLR